MWAAATSGKHAIACHLLACLLARIWDAPEAISCWMELIMRRKQEISSDNEFGDPALMVASQESFQRKELADWDASARAWLRIADSVMVLQQTQLRLIMDNISLPVNCKADSYESIMDAWKSSLQQIESLLVGCPQIVRDGAIILGLDAWHLYPDMTVLGPEEKDVKQNDPLFQGRGVLTVGLGGEPMPGHEGIYWSLPLRHLRHYGLPITRMRSINSGEGTRITAKQLLLVMTAAYVRAWDDGSLPTDSVLAFFAEVAGRIHDAFESRFPDLSGNPAAYKRQVWLNVLAESAKMYIKTTGPEKKLLEKLWKLGKAHSPMFLGTQPFFDLFTVDKFLLTVNNTDEKVDFLRKIARSSDCSLNSDFLIRYRYQYHPTKIVTWEYATAIPLVKQTLSGVVKESHFRWIPCESFASEKEKKMEEEYQNFRGALQRRKVQLLLMGESVESSIPFAVSGNRIRARAHPMNCQTSVRAGLYVSVVEVETCQLLRRVEEWANDENDDIFKKRIASEAQKFESTINFTTTMKQEMFKPAKVSFRACAEILALEMTFAIWRSDLLILRGIAAIAGLYEGLNGATVDVKSVKLNLSEARWLDSAVDRQARTIEHYRRSMEPLHLDYATGFACISMLETGSFNLDPGQLDIVMALSAANSLYVASCLLHDPSDSSHRFCIQRLTGNVGRAGIAFLVPPVDPMIKAYDAINEWQLLDYADFDGQLQDNFSSTSLQLSFTEAIFPINVGFCGGVDTEAFFLETLVSVYDSGHWVADIDVLKALGSASVYRVRSCADVKSGCTVPKFTSIDRFAEMLCEHDNTCIVRAWGNWQARLAATTICIAKGYSVVVMHEEVCWRCIQIQVDNARSVNPSQKVFVIS